MLGKDLLGMEQLTGDEILRLLQKAAELKAQLRRGEFPHLLDGKILALVFQKPSLRTRVSFEVGMAQLGGRSLYLSPQEVGLGKREDAADAARVLSRYVDGIVARTFLQEHVDRLAANATVPVINGLSDEEHPCQILAGLLTIQEHLGRLAEVSLAYVGDGNNVAQSWLAAAPKVGMNIAVASPSGFEPAERFVDVAASEAKAGGTSFRLCTGVAEAVRGADVVYTDVWYSMGEEDQREQRRAVFAPYQVSAQVLAMARPGALVMHCLPAHRGEEITDEVLDGPQCVALDEAENRLHAQKALLVELMGRAGGTHGH